MEELKEKSVEVKSFFPPEKSEKSSEKSESNKGEVVRLNHSIILKSSVCSSV